ncbi:ComEC/Rec2 family competence protein [Campylobacter fetus]|uniref:ComEC/Rec2 family competence protein n=1 Tax=Campylobacter fetus TaxID=196 RepID=UPI00050919D3|nr:ComEC/Rec2 family competence protein [Campylobacter fetus]AIR78682.1 competence protein, ComEC family [Campylobacter fetus subsp. fetus 04/554]EAJ5693104.1 ComEC/Rec2 family competence protein [Campylobacter fetus]EAJ5704689.1 ComEC/Rec2 family competence protein [Campylobacter fetus]EAJ9256258.1 ComEC/Rec2 family competence protein [Campylobacter fetus]EAK0814671.1 ComEC/Rec2 family competence protein [Campylobacter fetus]
MNLFQTKMQIATVICLCILIFGVNLMLEYFKFESFRDAKYSFINAKIIQNYEKQGKNNSYFILKLKSNEFTFYTRTKNKIDFTDARVGVISKNLKFKEYLKNSFFLPNFKIEPQKSSLSFTDNVQNSIENQHENPKLKELYSALYIASPINKDLRANVTNWGIAHIIAISGFHLSLIFAFIFFIVKPVVRPLQSRYFPYVNINFHLSIFIFILMGFYLYILDFTPSFLRSYIMGVFGFLLLSRGLSIFKFGNLCLTILIAVAFSPKLLFSIEFYFSCLGVFFIFLYIHHFGDKNDLKSRLKIALHTLYLEIFVFGAMNIPVYYFFTSASLYQLSVIPLAYVFVVFYPLSIILHFFNLGGIFDSQMLAFLEFANKQSDIFIPFWIFVFFNFLLIPAIKFKSIAIFLSAGGMVLFIFSLIF